MGNHRAVRRKEGVAPAPTHAGKRRADKGRAARRGASRRTIPALPSIIGAVVLLAAAAAALGFSQGQLPGTTVQLSAGGSQSLNGTDAFSLGGGLDSRALAISRDSERQALKDAADASLKQATEEQSQQRNAALASLAKSAQNRADEIAKNLWVLPTVGYHLTARFGAASGLWSHGHTGLDFAAPSGTPIYAVANGVITSTGYDGSYGNKTVETLDDGTEIWYAHQSEIGVTVGQRVTQSQQIGRIGSTGNVTGPHVHIEVRPGGGDPIDPYPAFIYHGVQP